MEEHNNLKIQGFLLVMFGLLFEPRIQSRHSGKVAKSFLRFRVSHQSLRKDLATFLQFNFIVHFHPEILVRRLLFFRTYFVD
jgi:hypothetical protein